MAELERELRDYAGTSRTTRQAGLIELFVRYARGIDRWDEERVLACFHLNVTLHYNTYVGNAIASYEALWASTLSSSNVGHVYSLPVSAGSELLN